MKKVFSIFILMMFLFVFVGCSNKADNYDGSYGPSYSPMSPEDELVKGEGYNEITELPFISTNEQNNTFFRLDSNTGSYSNLRRYIERNQPINGDIIKTDELINYFSYDLPEPNDGEDFSITANMMETPWNPETNLITIGVKSKTVELSQNIRNNLVFLIDISGSMATEEKLGLIKKAFPLMLDGLNDSDLISIVTYASGVKTHLSGCAVSNRQTIINVINGLKAGGGTSGSSGLQMAYDVAKQHYIQGGNNRIILATDGDFNIGPSSNEELKAQVQQQLNSGVYLSVLGVGMGNYQDDMVETLAMHGNGNYAYIDSLIEARKVLTEDLATTLLTIAKDVKVKVEFNPEIISEYRVIGYENKQLTEDEFNNQEADSGEVGTGHTTVVTYEVKLNNQSNFSANSKILDITINYKDPQTDVSKSIFDTFYVEEINEEVSEDFIFVSCLVEFSLILRDSEYKASASLTSVIERLESLTTIGNDLYKQEFISLVKKVANSNLIKQQ